MARTSTTLKTKSKTVSVGSKLPGGIILRVDDMVETQEPVFGGGFKTVKIAQQKATVQLYGTAVPFGQQRRCRVVGGYAITDGVDAEFMAAWLDANKNSELVKNNVIIVHSDTAGAAREHRSVKSGLEPLDVTTRKDGKFVDKRMPASVKSFENKPADEE